MRNQTKFVLFLGSSAFSALTSAMVAVQYGSWMGFGWSVKPAFAVVAVIFTSAFVASALERIPFSVSSLTSLIFLGAMLADTFALPKLMAAWLGVFVALVALLLVQWKMAARCAALGFWMVGTYVQAVFFYNLLQSHEWMSFFGSREVN